MTNFLKILTTRNAFSREYGTWLILLFNLIQVPILLHKITFSVFAYCLSIILFLMFRFELLDIISVEFSNNRKLKAARGLIYLVFSLLIFLYLVIQNAFSLTMALIISISGLLMLVLNILTRRKKGIRQNLLAQIGLVCYVVLLGSVNYYLLTGLLDRNMLIIEITGSLFYSCSVLYVRSKTMGSPYDIAALIFSITSVGIILSLSLSGITKTTLFIVMLPTLVKTLDNVILSNNKVPLRRIGLNETLHGLIYLMLFYLLF